VGSSFPTWPNTTVLSMQSLQKDLAPFSYCLERLLRRLPCSICDLFISSWLEDLEIMFLKYRIILQAPIIKCCRILVRVFYWREKQILKYPAELCKLSRNVGWSHPGRNTMVLLYGSVSGFLFERDKESQIFRGQSLSLYDLLS
jgi:hypothetical protein